MVGEPTLVAKVYHQPLSSQRAEKIKTMTAMASPELDRFSAWPRDLLMEGSQARGLLMPRVASRKELHNLHGPKSRKAEFPDAGFDFLIHVALNIARAFTRLHTDGVIVGDVNDRGIMAGNDGTVRLIDCDSFQISTQRKTFYCDVAVPEYTPPELQGRSLSGVLRTENHDAFGLAVLVFRLLFMGRHPFAGIFRGGHKEIHEAIREGRYAYAQDTMRTHMQPPPNMLAVGDGGGPTIANLFEQAFAPGATCRPAAREWVAALDALRSNLATCNFNSAHAYFRSLTACPWCELEQRFNVDFFHFIPAGGAEAQSIDVEAIWQALGALKVPDVPAPIAEALVQRQPVPIPPQLLRLRDEAVSLASEAKRARNVAERMRKNADRKRHQIDSLVATLTNALSNVEISRLEYRLAQLKGPERRYLLKHVLTVLRVVIVIAALLLHSVRFWTIAIAIYVASYTAVEGIDAPMARLRRWMARRVERRLDRTRRVAIQTDPELKARFDAAQEEADGAEREARHTDTIASALEKAAAKAQSEYARESRSEIEARDQQLKLAQEGADAAWKKISQLSDEAKTLKSTIAGRLKQLASSRAALDQLTRQRDADYKKLREQDRTTQLNRFLDSYYINGTDIKGITPGLKSALASFGIETAADISEAAVLKVPGFGKIRTQRMLDWRHRIARKFRYQAGSDIDPTQRKAIESKYSAGRLRVARDFTTAQTELERRIRQFSGRVALVKQFADEAIGALVQARLNRKELEL